MSELRNANLLIGDGKSIVYRDCAKRMLEIRANQEIGVPGDPGGPEGWHSRGYLPHFDGPNLIQHITFHLADSLAKSVLDRFEEEIRCMPKDKQNSERRKRVEAWLDAGHGSCIMREPSIAMMVQNALLFFDGQRCRVFAWVVMPNHVHTLIQPINDWPLAKIVESWKKFTAMRISAFRKETISGNASLLSGDETKHVWHREYWDRFIRNEDHFRQTIEYIHFNPVKAKLVDKAEDWMWSSASVIRKYANQEIGVPENL